jgi:hypothetical protein
MVARGGSAIEVGPMKSKSARGGKSVASSDVGYVH